METSEVRWLGALSSPNILNRIDDIWNWKLELNVLWFHSSRQVKNLSIILPFKVLPSVIMTQHMCSALKETHAGL